MTTTTSEKDPSARENPEALSPSPNEEVVGAPDEPSKRTRRQVWMFAIVLALLSAASLILLLTMTGGDDITGSEADITLLSQNEVSETLLRTGAGPGDLELELLYTPEWYFSWSGRPNPETDGTPILAFLVFETTHLVDLPTNPPTLIISTPSGPIESSSFSGVTDSPHHRVSQVYFPAVGTDGTPLLHNDETLSVTATWPDVETTLTWEQPMPFGLNALNAEIDTAAGFTFRSPALTIAAIAAIFTGMLAALTPCLLLLAAYYTAVLSGTAAAGVGQRGAERKLLMTGVFFVGGFTAVYTAGGIVAGYIGDSVSRFDIVGSYARPVSIVAGLAVIGMGIRTASQANVPLVCKIPGFNRPSKSGTMGSAAMGSMFAIGCLSCFSATVLTAMLLYAGATGSPLAGGLVMLMFSAGVGVMFLVASILVARAAPLATWLAKIQPVIGVISAVVMIFLGGLMVTYKFHLFTGYLFELWS